MAKPDTTSPRSSPQTRLCSWCAGPFVSARATRHFCGRLECNSAREWAKARLRRQAYRLEFVCAQCGTPHAVTIRPQPGRPPTDVRRFCDRRCLKRYYRRQGKARDRERARLRAIGVFGRDSWVCQLCFRKCLRRVPPNHPLAATIDHIIAKGKPFYGTDDPSNLQTAHRKCNEEKGCRIRGQLRLQYA